ncbi:MAG: hypothetical protein FWH44_06100, partial [Methanomassiliicoccaceae archaeon]|nr:hypothetical protein [Methanomassiliicoccaceae archaeon]
MKMKKMNTEGRTEVRSKAVIATAAIALALIMIASSALILSGNDNDDGTGYVLGADDTVDISSCTDADDVRAAIEGKIAGMGAGDTLTVTGSLTGITECLTLDIGVIDIRWCAEYSAEVTDGNVLDITSDGGMFTVSVNGTDEGIMTLTGDVEVNSSADAALIAAGGGKLTIDGNVTVTAADGDLWLYSFNNGILTIDGNVTVTAA